jgi:hypothetical protein
LNLAGHSLTVVDEYFRQNVQTLFQVNTFRNPDIWSPGNGSTGCEREIASHNHCRIDVLHTNYSQFVMISCCVSAMFFP